MPEGGGGTLPELASRELSRKLLEGEAKLEQGSLEEAEVTLREALSINNEEARALLGRIEYRKGNFQGALRLLEGIHLSGLAQSLRYFASERTSWHHKKGKNQKPGTLKNFLHASSLLIEAIYLKAKSFQKLGATEDAAHECQVVLNLMEEAFPEGMPALWGDTSLAKLVNKITVLYPQLLAQAGLHDRAVPAYRQALLSTWGRNEDTLAGMRKEFAILLLYGGVDASSSPADPKDGRYVPNNTTEEAILLLLLLLRRNIVSRGVFDYSVLDHLAFALSVCGQSSVLAHQYEELLPGTMPRTDRWYNLALCYRGAGEDDLSLNLLRKALSPVERPNDVASLLLAANICAAQKSLVVEGVAYAERALENMSAGLMYMKSRALHVLGVAFGTQARVASSDSERAQLQQKALEALQEAAVLESEDPTIVFDLGLEYAMQRQLSPALDCAKRFLDISSGAWVEGWRFLALLLTAQERHSEAELVLEAATDKSSRWEQGRLLQTRAKIQMATGQPLRAVHTYRQLLTLVNASHSSFSFEAPNWSKNKAVGRVEEVEVWQDLASVYTELKQWRDAETCLEKAQALKTYSADTWCATGKLHEAQGQTEEAIASYRNAFAVDITHVDSKVRLGALLRERGGIHSLPVARSYLAEALQAEPTHEEAWLQMGLLHKAEGHTQEAIDCLQAAAQLEQSSPVVPFSSILPCIAW
jgi:tetratricopeptide (TPR) repeat protein